jgi:hypothetical protein
MNIHPKPPTQMITALKKYGCCDSSNVRTEKRTGERSDALDDDDDEKGDEEDGLA